MQLTDLTIRLLLLFFPGIVCFLIVESLTVHRERKGYEVLFFILLYGMLSYLICACLLVVLGIRFSLKRWVYVVPPEMGFLKFLTNSNANVDIWEVAWATPAAIVLAFFLSFCNKKKLLHAMAHKLKVSSKIGDPDIWAHAFNFDDAHWCVVRDLANKLMFQGYAQAFSDVEENAEVLLTDVIVYNEQTTEECYRAKRMYLARKKDDVTIEFQVLEEGEEDGRETEENDGGSAPSVERGHREQGRSESAEHEQGAATETRR